MSAVSPSPNSLDQSTDCIFCKIIAGKAPVSLVHQDDHCLAFMTLHQVRPGELLIIPREHIDHFTDLDESLAVHIMRIAHRLARILHANLVPKPERMGFLIHGYGVAHAHLIVVPQHHPHDLTSARFATIRDGEIVFALDHLPLPTRAELDERAAEIRGWMNLVDKGKG